MAVDDGRELRRPTLAASRLRSIVRKGRPTAAAAAAEARCTEEGRGLGGTPAGHGAVGGVRGQGSALERPGEPNAQRACASLGFGRGGLRRGEAQGRGDGGDVGVEAAVEALTEREEGGMVRARE